MKSHGKRGHYYDPHCRACKQSRPEERETCLRFVGSGPLAMWIPVEIEA